MKVLLCLPRMILKSNLYSYLWIENTNTSASQNFIKYKSMDLICSIDFYKKFSIIYGHWMRIRWSKSKYISEIIEKNILLKKKINYIKNFSHKIIFSHDPFLFNFNKILLPHKSLFRNAINIREFSIKEHFKYVLSRDTEILMVKKCNFLQINNVLFNLKILFNLKNQIEFFFFNHSKQKKNESYHAFFVNTLIKAVTSNITYISIFLNFIQKYNIKWFNKIALLSPSWSSDKFSHEKIVNVIKNFHSNSKKKKITILKDKCIEIVYRIVDKKRSRVSRISMYKRNFMGFFFDIKVNLESKFFTIMKILQKKIISKAIFLIIFRKVLNIGLIFFSILKFFEIFSKRFCVKIFQNLLFYNLDPPLHINSMIFEKQFINSVFMKKTYTKSHVISVFFISICKIFSMTDIQNKVVKRLKNIGIYHEKKAKKKALYLRRIVRISFKFFLDRVTSNSYELHNNRQFNKSSTYNWIFKNSILWRNAFRKIFIKWKIFTMEKNINTVNMSSIFFQENKDSVLFFFSITEKTNFCYNMLKTYKQCDGWNLLDFKKKSKFPEIYFKNKFYKNYIRRKLRMDRISLNFKSIIKSCNQKENSANCLIKFFFYLIVIIKKKF